MYKSEKLDLEIRMLGRILGDVIREQAGMDRFAVAIIVPIMVVVSTSLAGDQDIIDAGGGDDESDGCREDCDLLQEVLLWSECLIFHFSPCRSSPDDGRTAMACHSNREEL